MRLTSQRAEIVPGLWLGSLASLRTLEDDGSGPNREWMIISILENERLLSLANDILRESSTNITYQQRVWKLQDKCKSEFLSETLVSILDTMDEFIPSAERTETHNKRSCFVHCALGLSRSASVCAAWLISRRQMSLESALDQIRSVRPEVNPNLGFLASLRALEQSEGNVTNAIERMYSPNKTA